jgi:glycerophosphoryl diester phosphodiesterase
VGKTKTIGRFALTAAALVAAVLVVLGVGAHFRLPPAIHPFFGSDDRLWVIAHRGGRGLWPESTRYAFEHAAALGVDVIEFDLRLSKDAVPVILHDPTVDRTTDGSGPVTDLTIGQLKQLDAGYRWTPDGGRSHPMRGKGLEIPTLQEVFSRLPHMRMNIELKSDEPLLPEALCAAVRDHRMSERVLVAAFRRRPLERFRRACPEVATSAASVEVQVFWGLQYLGLGAVYAPSARALQVPEWYGNIRVVTPGFLRAAHRQNLKVHVWTVNAPEAMRRLAAMGVDGLITDYPDRLLKEEQPR